MNAEMMTEDQFCEYIVAQLKKYAWSLAREGKLLWIVSSHNSDFALVKNHATCDVSLTHNGKIIYRASVYTKEIADKWGDLLVKCITLNNIDTLIR